MPRILQEADEILYRAALSVERRCYRIHFPNKRVHDLGSMHTKTEIVGTFAKEGKVLGRHYKLEFYRECEPASHAFRIVDNTIKRIMKHGDSITLFISPPDGSNFRNKVAITPGPRGAGYKAGRSDKPLLYKEVREYILRNYNTHEIYGHEADDGLGIHNTDDCILSHIDKDIDMIPGNHLNWVSGHTYTTSDPGQLNYKGKKLVGGGLKWFYLQLLTGDATDNIPGIKGIGPKGGFNILNKLENEQEWATAVGLKYKEAFADDWHRRLLEIADLIWICRQEGVTGCHYISTVLSQVMSKI